MQKTASAIPGPFDLIPETLQVPLNEVIQVKYYMTDKNLFRQNNTLADLTGKILVHYKSGNEVKLKQKLQDYWNEVSTLTKPYRS